MKVGNGECFGDVAGKKERRLSFANKGGKEIAQCAHKPKNGQELILLE